MKRYLYILLTLFILSADVSMATTYSVRSVPNVQRADRTRFVSNPDGILSAEAVATLDSICYSLRERGIAEVAIVAVDNIDTEDYDRFAYELFESWGVGDDKLDNGLGILLVEELHAIRFETGYGLEAVLPDGLCGRIQRTYMVPYFSEGRYSDGMVEGMRAIDTVLSGGEVPLAEEEADSSQLAGLVIVIVMVVLPMLLILRRERQLTKCPSCGHHKLRVVKRDIQRCGPKIIVVETLYCDHCHTEHRRTSERDDDHHGPRRGGGLWIFPMGGFGGGGFGGGGFGGGSFGGGGAGSRW